MKFKYTLSICLSISFSLGQILSDEKIYHISEMPEVVQGAASGNAAMQFVLGSSMLNLSPPKIMEGIDLLKKSANQNYAIAQRELAAHYFTGKIVKSNPKEGYYWLKKAAANGDEKAIKMIHMINEKIKLQKKSKE